ncbi:hypothetical protein I302_104824 [Kwoniella bestiolae CBS 10118]|uniref:Hypervirulence associated protein TUDOR domain-containing protein n=1 Tax=Kwoniella bestiolae CBS 10118 TaxID=1296100 RepID=A0A1B9FRM9_9TREE|nr:hypothetical protein I302_09107 [Kwoniella bestiolae CBS 10118]OCF21429.1 hypothetical protein I302_09107 [Kwoniella bestiolae CBS 10118]
MAPKSDQDVVNDFNEIVNMTADELEAFLKTEGSETTGFQKEDGSGESIGHESGRKIVDILKRNPDKDPSKYTEEDKEHMRRVVSYCKRHLAQEGKLKETKTPEELEKTKSTRSLKNWGHDPMKTLPKSAKPTSKKSEKPPSKKADKPKSKGKSEQADEKKDQAEDQKDDAEDKKGEEPEKPKSKGRGRPPNSKKEDSPKKPSTEDAEVGEKRGRGRPPTSKKEESPKQATEEDKDKEVEKPASKKAKTATEGTRKPPSRGVKKG